MFVASFGWSDLGWLALAIFLIAIGVTCAYMLVRLAGLFGRLTSLVSGVERDALPVVRNVNETVTLVNGNLEELGQVTASAASAAGAADTAVRAVSLAITKPVQKATGLAAGFSEGLAELRQEGDWRKAVDVAGRAARRREDELAEELRDARRAAPDGPPPAA
jgi:hypothetical protein